MPDSPALPAASARSYSRRHALATLGAAGLAWTGVARGAEAGGANAGQRASRLYGTLAELKADSGWQAGMLLRTAGYHQVGDGGQGEYAIAPIDAGQEEDGGSLIALGHGLGAHLCPPPAVNYALFGAGFDPQGDDAPAIKAAHEYANRLGLPVVNPHGNYVLREPNAIPIQTSVQWGGTVFHLDEVRNSRSTARFVVTGDEPVSVTLDAAAKQRLLEQLHPGASMIPELAAYRNCLVWIRDEQDRIGFRAGAAYSGQSWPRQELFYVEEHGRIIGDIAWRFKDYTHLAIQRCAESYLIIEGGSFRVSGADPAGSRGGYHQLGIQVRRSRTILRNQWVGLAPGAADVSNSPRSGFYSFNTVYDVRLENVRLLPWEKNRRPPATTLSAGTYGISGNRLLNATFANLTAEGGPVHWGVFGTNMNKNFRIERCRLNRIDVHFHCWNLHISDSEIGYSGISVTGGGDLTIERTTRYGNQFINFRRDFGAHWAGDIRIRHCRLIPSAAGEVSLLAMVPVEFRYGYPIGYGRTVRVEDVIIDYRSAPQSTRPCWLMKVAPWAQSEESGRLCFPQELEFRHIVVQGREAGVRLLELPETATFEVEHPGGYDGVQLRANSRWSFVGVQLEALAPGTGASPDPAHLVLQNPPGTAYPDERALYPRIHLVDCHGFAGRLARCVADLALTRCTVARLEVDEGGPHRGGLSFDECRFAPRPRADATRLFGLAAELGVSFSRCTLHAPEIDGTARPERADRYGFVEMNRSVRHNHLNTRLGNDLLAYWRAAGRRLEPAFIAQLQSHHELEDKPAAEVLRGSNP